MGWLNRAEYGSDDTCQYLKDSSGVVHIKGMVKHPFTAANPIFTLPAGYYRPGKQVNKPIQTSSGHGLLYIQQNGNVVVGVGGCAYVALDVNFYVGFKKKRMIYGRNISYLIS